MAFDKFSFISIPTEHEDDHSPPCSAEGKNEPLLHNVFKTRTGTTLHFICSYNWYVKQDTKGTSVQQQDSHTRIC